MWKEINEKSEQSYSDRETRESCLMNRGKNYLRQLIKTVLLL